MKKPWLSRAVWIVVLVVVAVLLYRAFQPAPVPVDVATIASGQLRVTVDDDGRTRVRERYTISAPIQGQLLRTQVEAGDVVAAGETVVAEFVPVAPGMLDARSLAEASARLDRAEAAEKEAEARRDQARADLRFAASELARVRDLVQSGARSDSDLEVVVRNEQSARDGLRAAEFAVQVARYETELARASLVEVGPEPAAAGTGNGDAGRRMTLRSPINGRVLNIIEESARSLAAGAPILEVGNTSQIEIVADYLSQDAVKVRPGMRVFVEGWGGELPSGEELVLEGAVRVVEPGGFTKISALGVEEQRVNIVVDPAGDPEPWSVLGDGYRVELRILLWEQGDVLIVPTGALFRRGEQWSVYVVEDETARLRDVTIGRRNPLEAEVAAGLAAGNVVVLYPSDLIDDGMPVDPRNR